MKVKIYSGLLEKNSTSKVSVAFYGHELGILYALFGQAFVTEVKEVGTKQIASPAEEAERLENKYGKLENGHALYSQIYPTLDALVTAVKEHIAADPEGDQGGDGGAPSTVADLKEFLESVGVEFDKRASKGDLLALYAKVMAEGDQGGDGGGE